MWNFAKLFGGPPDLIVKSPSFTMPAHAQDAWDKRSTPSGITEPRWVRAIEIRPATVKGRKIVHHALARLSQDDPIDNAAAGGNDDDDSDVNAGPGLFMEWAVGKQGEIMRPDTGKLLLPGSQFVWDIHYSAAGEEITNNVELGIYFYPKGQEPKYRQVLHADGHRRHRHPAEHHQGHAGLLRDEAAGARRELPAAHAPARQGDDDGSDPARPARRRC